MQHYGNRWKLVLPTIKKMSHFFCHYILILTELSEKFYLPYKFSCSFPTEDDKLVRVKFTTHWLVDLQGKICTTKPETVPQPDSVHARVIDFHEPLHMQGLMRICFLPAVCSSEHFLSASIQQKREFFLLNTSHTTLERCKSLKVTSLPNSSNVFLLHMIDTFSGNTNTRWHDSD